MDAEHADSRVPLDRSGSAVRNVVTVAAGHPRLIRCRQQRRRGWAEACQNVCDSGRSQGRARVRFVARGTDQRKPDPRAFAVSAWICVSPWALLVRRRCGPARLPAQPRTTGATSVWTTPRKQSLASKRGRNQLASWWPPAHFLPHEHLRCRELGSHARRVSLCFPKLLPLKISIQVKIESVLVSWLVEQTIIAALR